MLVLGHSVFVGSFMSDGVCLRLSTTMPVRVRSSLYSFIIRAVNAKFSGILWNWWVISCFEQQSISSHGIKVFPDLIGILHVKQFGFWHGYNESRKHFCGF